MKLREKTHNKYVVATTVMLFLLLGSFYMAFSLPHTEAKNMVVKNDSGGRAYIQHGIIRINNNSEFANMAANESWPGDGSEANPYVIEGYDIDAQGEGDAIYIGNTTVHFIIRNCRLYNASWHSGPYFVGAGITLYKVKNGTIENNTIYNNSYDGIWLYSFSSNTITNNTIYNNSYDGIWLYSFSSNTITNNTIYNNNDDGIHLYKSSSNMIANNIIHNNNRYGIYLGDSSSNTIANNTIYNNRYGIVLGDSSSNYIARNKIENNTIYGIYIYSGSNNHIYGNILTYNHGSNATYNSSHIQAKDNGNNNWWNSSSGYGNYWLDWAENNDTNDQNPQDGIVDWPYKIDGSAGAKDYYPLKITVPMPPQNLSAKAGDGYVNLTWDAPSDEGGSAITGYRIYRNGNYLITVPASQLWYNDTNVVNGQTYRYYVTAVNSVGESDRSNEVSATPGGEIPEFTPLYISVTILVLATATLMRRRKR